VKPGRHTRIVRDVKASPGATTHFSCPRASESIKSSVCGQSSSDVMCNETQYIAFSAVPKPRPSEQWPADRAKHHERDQMPVRSRCRPPRGSRRAVNPVGSLPGCPEGAGIAARRARATSSRGPSLDRVRCEDAIALKGGPLTGKQYRATLRAVAPWRCATRMAGCRAACDGLHWVLHPASDR
jgi:hypothetical protein